MNNFRIKTKRDWCIAAILATFVVYAISTRFSNTFQSILLKYGNPMMTKMNQPKSYGNIMFTVVIIMILIIIMLLKYKKSKKLIAVLAIGTVAVFFGIFQMYLYNVDQIVSVIEEEEGNRIFISYWGGEDLNVDEATEKKIFALCEELKPLPEAEQLKLRGELDDNGDYIEDTILLWSSYPEKWGHNFDLMVNVYEDKIFIDKGDDHKQQMIVTFYEDNGLLKLVNEVKGKQ